MNRALFLPADILLPKGNFEKWAVIACDQYTSEPEYWEHVKAYVGEKPSALHIIFPEVYLSENNQERIAQINANMKAYLENDIFDTYEHTFVYTKRTLLDGSVRRGIVGMIDLEDYSCEKGSHTLIRATEETVAERVPPRVEIRQDALLEMPHVMLLIDDLGRTVIEPLDEETESDRVLYDFDLMQNGGHLSGIAVNERAAARIQKSLETLTEHSEDCFLFAVGDGNHSLAAAKECYRMHPTENSRYALVEIVNIHDASLRFEPIYRVLFGVDPEDVIEDFRKALGGTYEGADAQRFTCVFGEKTVQLSVKPTAKLAVGTLQTYLDAFLQKHPSAFIDYIHGEASVYELTKAEHTLGFLFEGMRKTELFPAIRQDGSLPRKTFSMGHADEKRFYLECRSL